MIKHESITVSGVVMYCDECGARGDEAAYDNTEEVIEMSRGSGWTTDNRERDLCPMCSKSKKGKRR
jgi:hypothetical protein